LSIVDNGSGFAAIVERVSYQGGRTMLETAPATASDTTLTLSLPSAQIPRVGSTIRLALTDGWVIPQAAR
jgi:iron(III) transport system ATP-binding protein